MQREEFDDIYRISTTGISAGDKIRVEKFIKTTKDAIKGDIDRYLNIRTLVPTLKDFINSVQVHHKAACVATVTKLCFNMFYNVRMLEYDTEIHIHRHFASNPIPNLHLPHEYAIIRPVKPPPYSKLNYFYAYHPNGSSAALTDINQSVTMDMNRLGADINDQFKLLEMKIKRHIESTVNKKDAKLLIHNIIKERVAKLIVEKQKAFYDYYQTNSQWVTNIDTDIDTICTLLTEVLSVYNILYLPPQLTRTRI